MLIEIIITSAHITIQILEGITKYKKENLRKFFMFIFFALIIIFGISRFEYSAYIFPIVLLFSYPIALHFIYKSIETIHEEELAIVSILFLLISIIIITLYAIISTNFDLIQTAAKTKITFFDNFYWASTTFTTLGYGEYVPKNEAGKLLSITLSLTGIMHMVSFMAILLNKLNKKTTK